MKKIPYCVPQIIETVLDTAKIVSDEVFIHKKVLNTVIDKIANLEKLGDSAHDLLLCCLRTAYKALGAKDPYEQTKNAYNEFVRSQQTFFDELIAEAADQFAMKLNIAAALNYKFLCIGWCTGADMEKTVRKLIIHDRIAESEIETFRRIGKKAETLLYIVASAGEIVADAVLIREFARKYQVTVAVSSHPVICRATAADAQFCNLAEAAEIIDPGADMYGVHLEKASRNFREHFKNSDIVLVKNGVNTETIEGCGRDYFVLGADKRDKAAESSTGLSTNIRKFLEYIEA